ncbi:sigma-70 family RNA polymerase sigma factor [Microvirga tunisiensis]|uniref:Sigma-70 family RNA polymerase sigma factor n=2 Tax=Pannonibacter tanglangensis TaxID=2750084 RepID=A0ABW9ZF40_9HYPH|nr:MULTISPECIES: RNA polymerase sigma factor [unclassified Pannonibacter]NBN63460.1 sigma-70 family RNA polymerase sigma factor [Pannonibacter sp. XCT-34]NBN77097.1 sigma-70 family RNA polymerase sigma factor [Pannonibacter sp. XCT-53]
MLDDLPTSGLWASWIDDGPVLRRRAMRLTRGDREEAEDLLSSTLIKAISHVERSDTQVREPRAFLLFALKNEYISRLRKRNSERQVRDFSTDIYEDNAADLADSRPSQEHLLWQQEALGRVMRLIDRLPAEHRRIFEMRFCDEASYRDIAVALGISEPLARKRVQNLRQMLRQGLETGEEPALVPPASRRKA